jgi:hypothetical protein
VTRRRRSSSVRSSSTRRRRPETASAPLVVLSLPTRGAKAFGVN